MLNLMLEGVKIGEQPIELTFGADFLSAKNQCTETLKIEFEANMSGI